MIIAAELDFQNKVDRQVTLEDLSQTLKFCDETTGGKFRWIDFSGEHVEAAVEVVEKFGVQRAVLDEVTRNRPVPYFLDLDECIFFTFLDADWSVSGVSTIPIAVFFGPTYMVTVHRDPSTVIDSIHKSYLRNFRRIALSPGFLLYELADHLSEEYTQVICEIAEDTEVIEDSLFEKSDEGVFTRVADLMRSTVEFYKVVVFAREVVHDLATTRSPFIHDTTQPYLEKKAVLLDRLSADIAAEREVLSESVNLYLSIVTHTTNKFLSRLTALGTLFLPLSFFAGVYGMNFDNLPELHWQYGYHTFWAIVITFTVSLLAFMKHKNWL